MRSLRRISLIFVLGLPLVYGSEGMPKGFLKITSENFTDDLLDGTSEAYQALKKKVEAALDAILEPALGGAYLGATVLEFRSGSVEVDYVVNVTEGVNMTEVVRQMNSSIEEAMETASFGNMSVSEAGISTPPEATETTSSSTNSAGITTGMTGEETQASSSTQSGSGTSSSGSESSSSTTGAGTQSGSGTTGSGTQTTGSGTQSGSGTTGSGMQTTGSGTQSGSGTTGSGMQTTGLGTQSGSGTTGSGMQTTGSGTQSGSSTTGSGMQTSSASSASQDANQGCATTSECPTGFLRITSETFTAALEDPSSDKYKNLKDTIEKELDSILRPVLGEKLIAAVVTAFKNGSINATYTVNVTSDDDMAATTSLINSTVNMAVATNQFQNISVSDAGMKPPISSTSEASLGLSSNIYDATAVSGEAVLIQFFFTSLSPTDVNQYMDESSTKYATVKSANFEIDEFLKGSTQNDLITSDSKFIRSVKMNSSTIRAEFLASCKSSLNLFVLHSSIEESFSTKEAFKTAVGLPHKLQMVSLPNQYRYYRIYITFTTKIWDEKLASESSTEFADFKELVLPEIGELLKSGEDRSAALTLNELRSGSIVADFSLLTSNASSSITKNTLQTALYATNQITGMPVSDLLLEDEMYVGALNPALSVSTEQPFEVDYDELEDDYRDLSNIGPLRQSSYIINVTVPCFAAILVFVLIVMCCTSRSDSCLCRLCGGSGTSSVP